MHVSSQDVYHNLMNTLEHAAGPYAVCYQIMIISIKLKTGFSFPVRSSYALYSAGPEKEFNKRDKESY